MSKKKKKKQEKTDVEKLQREYEQLKPVAERFSVEMVRQVETLLQSHGITLGFPIQTRVKAWESLEGKFRRLNRCFKNILEVQDIVGMRIILLFRRDAEKISKLLSDNFKLIREYDTSEKLNEDQFGYSSVHLIVEMPDEWLKVPTFAGMGGLKAEIQVRSLPQHIWAETSQALQYKQQESVPQDIRRSIYRLSALLETVDLEMERVLTERESYRANIDPTGAEGRLNVDVIEKTLDELLPPANKIKDEKYSELLEELQQFGVNTQEELRELIKTHMDAALEEDSNLVMMQLRMLHEEGLRGDQLPERAGRGVFLTHVGLVEEILRMVYDKEHQSEPVKIDI